MTELARAVVRLKRAALDVLDAMSPAQVVAITTRRIDPEPLADDDEPDEPRIATGLHPGTASALRSAGLVESLEAERGRRHLTPAAILVLRCIQEQANARARATEARKGLRR